MALVDESAHPLSLSQQAAGNETRRDSKSEQSAFNRCLAGTLLGQVSSGSLFARFQLLIRINLLLLDLQSLRLQLQTLYSAKPRGTPPRDPIHTLRSLLCMTLSAQTLSLSL